MIFPNNRDCTVVTDVQSCMMNNEGCMDERDGCSWDQVDGISDCWLNMTKGSSWSCIGMVNDWGCMIVMSS